MKWVLMKVIRLRWPPQYVRTHRSGLTSKAFGGRKQEQRIAGGARPIGVLLMQLRMLDIERRILTWKVGIKTPGQESFCAIWA